MASGNPECGGCRPRLKLWFSRLPELRTYAGEGCPYCSLFLQGVLQLVPNIEEDFGYDASFRFERGGKFLLYVDPNGSIAYVPGRKALVFEWEFYKVGQRRLALPPGDTSADASFAKAWGWIEDCLANHKLCQSGGPSPLPSRALDLGDGIDDEPQQIKLIEEPGRKEYYIALSHSWGGDQPLKTTASALADRKTGIAFAQLPKTFQDAVRITKRLGVRYLWIDSLCIIQDSADDWETESSRMGSVYRNSWLTVSATRSTSTASGCFTSGHSIDLSPAEPEDPVLAVLFPAAAELKRDLRLNLRFAIAHPNLDKYARARDNDPFPLFARAWAYQERLLAPRVLHFAPGELFWECAQALDCECGAAGWSGARDMGGYLHRETPRDLPPKVSHYAALHVGAAARGAVEEEKRRKKLLGRWEDMVREYTLRRLTRARDRLPALSGVAAEMVAALGMGYCAGLWRETAPLGLLWERQNCTEPGWPCGEARPAPSWSWASVDAPAAFLVSLAGHRVHSAPVMHADVEDMVAVPAGKDARGEVRLGESFVTIMAQTVPAFLSFSSDDDFPSSTRSVRTAIRKGVKGPTSLERSTFKVQVRRKEPIFFVPDVAPCDAAGDWAWGEDWDLTCAKILAVEEFVYWLVLREVDKATSTYERVGVFEASKSNCNSKGPKQRIKII